MAFFPRHLAATAVLAALALPALAQTSPAAPSADAGATTMRGPHMGRHAPNPARMHERAARLLATLKEKLQITPAQEPAWAAFASAMQPGQRPARLDMQNLGALTTPERIDRMRALRAQVAAEADRRGEATKTFYAVLTPAQQKTFDEQTLRLLHRARAHGWGRHGMHGDGEAGGRR